MAVVLTITSPASERWTPQSLSGTGLTATTAYILTYTTPDGGTRRIEVTTDGSGAFTAAPIVPQQRGSYSFAIRPATEFNGTTTALGTATLVVA